MLVVPQPVEGHAVEIHHVWDNSCSWYTDNSVRNEPYFGSTRNTEKVKEKCKLSSWDETQGTIIDFHKPTFLRQKDRLHLQPNLFTRGGGPEGGGGGGWSTVVTAGVGTCA
jgi:hypothetical protein